MLRGTMRAFPLIPFLLLLLWLAGCAEEQAPVMVQVQPFFQARYTLNKPLKGIDVVVAKQAALYQQLDADPAFKGMKPQIIVAEDSVTIRAEGKMAEGAEQQLTAATRAMVKTFSKGNFSWLSATAPFVNTELQRRVGEILQARLENMGIKSTVEPAGDGQVKITPRREIGDREMTALTTPGRLELRLLPKEITVNVDNGTVTAARNDKPIPATEALHYGYFVLDNTSLERFEVAPSVNRRPAIAFEATPQGAQRLREITATNVDRMMLVVIDGQIIMAPVIKAAISGEGIIEGNFTEKEAQDFVSLFNAGLLPAKVTVVDGP
ncbi:MAG: SecDF P1 head subdomain-containing protein [Armatimonadota bacterium]